MQFNQSIPLLSRPKYAEGSKLTSKRDDRNNSFLWKKGELNAGQIGSLSQAVQKLSREVAKQRRRIVGGGGLVGVSIQQFAVVSDGGDYYNCYTFDGLTAGTTIIKVAKHLDLQCITSAGPQAPVSPLPLGGGWYQKLIRTITYTYTYTPTAGTTTDGVNVIEYVRGVTGSDASSETDYVTPCLNVNDIITGFQTSFAAPATLVGVTWQAMADGRAWAAQ